MRRLANAFQNSIRALRRAFGEERHYEGDDASGGGDSAGDPDRRRRMAPRRAYRLASHASRRRTLNTAIEKLCDRLHPERDPAIGYVKDLGSAAVLAALLAVAVLWLGALWAFASACFDSLDGSEISQPGLKPRFMQRERDGGRSRTRTYEGVASGFTVRPLCRSDILPNAGSPRRCGLMCGRRAEVNPRGAIPARRIDIRAAGAHRRPMSAETPARAPGRKAAASPPTAASTTSRRNPRPACATTAGTCSTASTPSSRRCATRGASCEARRHRERPAPAARGGGELQVRSRRPRSTRSAASCPRTRCIRACSISPIRWSLSLSTRYRRTGRAGARPDHRPAQRRRNPAIGCGFAASAVIVTGRHTPEVTGVLAKAASRALEHVPFVEVRNLAKALDELGSRGFQRIGLDSDGDTAIATSPSGARSASCWAQRARDSPGHARRPAM